MMFWIFCYTHFLMSFFSGLTLFAIFCRKNIPKSRICRSIKLEQMCVYHLSIPRKEECLRNEDYWPPFRAASRLKSVEFHQLTSFVHVFFGYNGLHLSNNRTPGLLACANFHARIGIYQFGHVRLYTCYIDEGQCVTLAATVPSPLLCLHVLVKSCDEIYDEQKIRM